LLLPKFSKIKKISIILGLILATSISILTITFIIEIEASVSERTITFDENGIPFVEIGEISGTEIGKQRHYIFVYRYANNYYKDFVQNGNETAKILFF